MESKSFSRIYFRALTSIHIYNGQICTEEAVKTSVCMCVCVYIQVFYCGFILSAAGMRVLHWCMLGVTILLLLCEVTISQLCKSLITLVDGFHTLFVLLLMAPPPPPPPQTASIKKPPLPSLDPSTSPPHGSCSPAELPSILPAQSSIEPPAGARAQGPPRCGVSFPSCRLQPLGAFISALLLTFLCLTYFMEIISFSLEPHPARRPLLLVVVGAASLLYKLLVVRLNWDQLQKERAKAGWNQSHLEETHTGDTSGSTVTLTVQPELV